MKTGRQGSDLERICRDISDGKFKLLYILTGSEDYLVFQARKLITQSLLGRFRAETVEIHDWNEISIQDIIRQLNLPMLFEPFRVIVVRDVTFLSSSKETASFAPLEEWLKTAIQRTSLPPAILICTASKIDGRTAAAKTVRKYGELLEFHPPQSYERGDRNRDAYLKIVEPHLQSVGKSIPAESWMELRRRVPNNLWAVMTSIEVLTVFTGDRSVIEPRDIEEMVSPGDELPAFAITEALGERSLSKVVAQIERILMTGTHPLMLSKILASRIRLMILLKEIVDSDPELVRNKGREYYRFKDESYPVICTRIEQDLSVKQHLEKLHPYAMYSIIRQMELFDRSQLWKSLRFLAGIDTALKSSTKPADLLLESALRPLCEGWS